LTGSYSVEPQQEAGTYDNLLPGDLFFATDTDGITYKVPYRELENIVGKEVAVLHIRNITGGYVKIQGHDSVTDIDGNVVNNGTEVDYTSGEYLIYGDLSQLKDSTANWDFGPLTSTAKRKSFADFVRRSANFNGDIQYLQTDSARDISYMFSGCKVFNQPVTQFNTSRVNTFRALFQDCFVFNQPVNHFDTSNAENLMLVFQNCSQFNQPVNNWNTSEVTAINAMFDRASVFNQELNSWDVSKVTNFKTFLARATAFNQPLDNWNPENCTNFESMFWLTEAFNQPIGSWNTKSAVNMDYIFYQTKSFNQNISQWCVSNASHTQWNYQCPITSANSPVWGTCPRGEDQV
jgi:surface protein